MPKKRGPIPVASAGDLPKDTPVVSLAFAKKHWGKGVLAAGTLGLGAYALRGKRTSVAKLAETPPAASPDSGTSVYPPSTATESPLSSPLGSAYTSPD